MAKQPNSTDTQETQTDATVPTSPNREVSVAKATPSTLKEVLEYHVVSSVKLEDFKLACDDFLNKGFTLIGGICVSHVTSPTQVTTLFSQAFQKVKTVLA